jgi:hypothetical protein
MTKRENIQKYNENLTRAEATYLQRIPKNVSFTCYNCGEPGHLAPNCTKPKWKHPKKPATANPTSTSENEIACMAQRVITHNDDVHQPPPDTPGIYYYNDDMLTLFVLNDVYANLHFEAFDFFSNEYSQTMRVDNESGFSHSQPSLM